MFNLNSPVMQMLSKAVDLLWLNILTLLCSIPIVTIGAAQAGLYHAVSNLQKDEGSVTKDFFHGFRSNFAQATALWLIWLGILLVIGFVVFFYLNQSVLPGPVAVCAWIMVALGALLWAFSASWVMPLQTCYVNTVRRTAENAVRMAMGFSVPSLGMALMNLVPVLVLAAQPVYFLALGVIWLGIWFSLAAYCNLSLAKKAFAKLPTETENDD